MARKEISAVAKTSPKTVSQRPAVKSKSLAPTPAVKPPAAKVAAKTTSAPARGKAKASPSSKPVMVVSKPVTVTLKHLAAGLSEGRGMPRREAEAFAVELIGNLVQQIKAGAKVKIPGLGIIGVKDLPARMARMARNPATSASFQVDASRKIVFRVSKELKEGI